MKKWIGLLAVAMCLFFQSAVAKADVIWTPDDSFFMEYEEDCVYIRRCFLVNAPGGEVIVQESPTDTKEVARVKNGTEVWVEWTYTDKNGNVWGTYDGWFDGNESGWLSLAYMDLIYDYISFEEEHGDEFVTETGLAELPEGAEGIYVWDYPGSPTCTRAFENVSTPEEMPTYSVVYEDEDGRTWGFCGYHYGWRNFWMCLDDVTADYEKLYGYEPLDPTPIIDENNTMKPVVPADEDAAVSGPDRIKVIIGAAVGGVVIVTVVVLVVMKKKMKKGM